MSNNYFRDGEEEREPGQSRQRELGAKALRQERAPCVQGPKSDSLFLDVNERLEVCPSKELTAESL